MQSLLHPELVRTICSDKARATPIQSRQTAAESRKVARPRRSWFAPTRRLLGRHQPAEGQS